MTGAVPRRPLRTTLTIVGCISACVIAGALYWYSKVEDTGLEQSPPSAEEETKAAESEGKGAERPAERSKADVLSIMDGVIEHQKTLRKLVRSAIDEMKNGKLVGVKQIYDFVASKELKDPLKAHNLSMSEFDDLMSEWQRDPDVVQRTLTIVNGPDADHESEAMAIKAATLSVDKIIEIHTGVLERLKTGQEDMEKLQKAIEAGASGGRGEFDPRIAHLVLQAMVGEHIEKNYDLTAEVVEYAAMAQHNLLMGKPSYIAIHTTIQEILDVFNP